MHGWGLLCSAFNELLPCSSGIRFSVKFDWMEFKVCTERGISVADREVLLVRSCQLV